MHGRRVAGVLFLSVMVGTASAEKPQVEYFRNGDVGVFVTTVQLGADVDIATTTFSVESPDDSLYLLYVVSSQQVHKYLAVRGQEGLVLTPNDQTRLDELNRQRQEWHNSETGFDHARVYRADQKLFGLKALLEDEVAKGKKGDANFIARTREAIKNTETEVKAAKEESRQYWESWEELDKEIAEIRSGARTKMLQDIAETPLKVYGRFQGTGTPTLSVLGRNSAELLSQPQVLANIKLNLPTADGGNDALVEGWALAQARYFSRYVLDSPFSSYYQYCLLQSVRKYGLAKSALPMRLQQTLNQARRPDLYSITTGALAIQESLQLDAMTGQRTVPDDRGVPLTSLTGPTIKSHPFEEMLKGRKPSTSPIAALVPYDAYYCRFASISKQIETSDLLKRWGTSLLRTLTVSARDSDLPTKYQNQLCIGVSILTRLFGDLVIGEIALTGSDPFLKEGTDLSAIIHVKNRITFDKQMQGYIDDALIRHRDAVRSTARHGGVDILIVATPDRRIASHSAYLNDYKVYTNSLDAMKRIINTWRGRRESMADNADFQYMRTIFPHMDEDGFLYFSDAFIRKLIGPRWKIESQRRIICQNHLRMIGNASTMYRAELRKPSDIKGLVDAEYLLEETLKCPDRGTYSIDPSGSATCSVHNRLRYCTPVDSVSLSHVSNDESEAYKAFVSNYNSYWSRYFDPIGIRFKVGNRVEVETCILPLIENSIYNQVRELVGGTPTRLASRVLTDRTIVSVATKFDLGNPKYADTLDSMQRVLFPTLPPITNAIGSSLAIGLCDSDVLFTVDDRALTDFGLGIDLETQLVIATILSSINLPAYAVLELKDAPLTDKIIRSLLDMVGNRRSTNMRSGFENYYNLDHYATGTHNGHPVHALTLRLFVIKFRLHYAIAANRLIVSTKRYVLEDVLNTLDARDTAHTDDPTANVHVDIRPQAFDKLKTATGHGWQERMRHACLKNLVPIRVLIENHGASVENIEDVSRRIEGVTLRCPAGGTYQHDGPRNLVYCTVHGDYYHPRQNAVASGQEPLIQFLKRLQDLSVSLRFTDEGIMTKVAFDLKPVQE